MSLLRKLLHLSPRDRWVLLQAGCVTLAVRLGLWLLPFAVVRRSVYWLACRTSRPRTAPIPIETLTWAVTVVSRRIPRATCLTQALVLQALLQRQGYASALHLGVRRSLEGGFQAHAWVERAERIVIGDAGGDLYTSVAAFRLDGV